MKRRKAPPALRQFSARARRPVRAPRVEAVGRRVLAVVPPATAARQARVRLAHHDARDLARPEVWEGGDGDCKKDKKIPALAGK